MRVTNNLLSLRAMQNLQKAMQNLEAPQSRVMTGKRITKPSDDPIDMARLVGVKATYSKQTQYEKNVASALDWMNTTSSTLENVIDVLDEVDGLISTLGDPATSAERQNAAVEVDLLLKNLLSEANRTFMGKYIFGGNETLAAPFIANYSGDEILSVDQNPDGIDGTRSLRLSDVDTITLNLPGDRVFQPSGSGADDDVFKLLVDLRTALETNDSDGMKDVQQKLDDAIKRISSENAFSGGSIRRLNDLQLRLEDSALLTDEQRSRLEDADIVRAMLDYNQAELTYQAALAATSRVIQISLVNFLR